MANLRQRHREDQRSACQHGTRDVGCQPALVRCDCFTRRRVSLRPGVGNPVPRSHAGLIFVKVTTALLYSLAPGILCEPRTRTCSDAAAWFDHYVSKDVLPVSHQSTLEKARGGRRRYHGESPSSYE